MGTSTIISNAAIPIAASIIGLFFALFSVLKDTAENNWKKQFRKQIRLGVIKSSLSYEDMMHIAERWGQDRKAILFSLRIMHSEAVSGEDADLCQNIQTIRELIKSHQHQEPYAELPENIGIQLSTISHQTPESTTQISQLASSLSELYSSNQLKLNRQVKLTYLGSIAGVIGILIGLAGLYIAFLSKV